MSQCRSTFDDVFNELRSHSAGGRFNAMFSGSRDRLADGMGDFLDELATTFQGRRAAQRVLDDAGAAPGVFAHPDDTRLQEIVEVRDRVLMRGGDDRDTDWRRGVVFAATFVLGAGFRDLPPIAADHQEPTR